MAPASPLPPCQRPSSSRSTLQPHPPSPESLSSSPPNAATAPLPPPHMLRHQSQAAAAAAAIRDLDHLTSAIQGAAGRARELLKTFCPGQSQKENCYISEISSTAH
jgi:hypothetical protein